MKELSGTLKPAEQEEDKLKHAERTQACPPRTLPRSSRILRAVDFRLVYDKGFRVSSPLFAAFCLARPAPSDGPRLGLTVPKAVGKAVDRNRIKRRLREAFRLHQSGINPKWDIVLNPRRPVLKASFEEIERALRRVIETCSSHR
jgi:ribonuclease P protein component